MILIPMTTVRYGVCWNVDIRGPHASANVDLHHQELIRASIDCQSCQPAFQQAAKTSTGNSPCQPASVTAQFTPRDAEPAHARATCYNPRTGTD
eukprot:3006149-Prymnesium_polylepis.1